MFDVGFWEITIIGIVALVIVGPERLPGLARTVGLWLGKGRRMLSDVKRDIDRELKASEASSGLGSIKKDIEDAGKEVQKVSDSVRKESGADELKGSFKDTFKDVAPAGESLKQEFKDIEASASEVANQAEKAGKELDDQTDADAKASPESSSSPPARGNAQTKSGGDAAGS